MNEDEIEIQKINEELRLLRKIDSELASLQMYCIYFSLFCLFLAALVVFLVG